MAKTKATQARDKPSAEMPPPAKGVRKPTSKKTINVAGLFKNAATCTRSPGVSKPAHNVKEHPIYKEAMSANHTYRKAAKTDNDNGVEEVYQELVSRINGLDIHGRPIRVPGLPTEAELQELEDQEKRTTRPLAEDVLVIESRRSDGNITTKDVTLGETLSKFNDFTETTSAELKAMFKDLEEVDSSIADLLHEMQYGMALHEAEADFCRGSVRFCKALEEARKATEEDMKGARKEDQDAATQRKAKWEQFLAEMGP